MKHLKEMTSDELFKVLCEYCDDKEMNMAEYACSNCIKDNEKICVECCGCYDYE